MKYEIGDKIRIKNNCENMDSLLFLKVMKQFEGKIARITKVSEYNYKINIGSPALGWHKEWLSPVSILAEEGEY